MKITELQLLNYLRCPIEYDYRYNKNIYLEEKVSMVKALNLISTYFYMNLINGKVLSTSALKRKWDSICSKHRLSPQQCVEGLGQIMKMYMWANNEELLVQSTDIAYSFVVNIKPKKYIDFNGEITTTVAIDKTGEPYLLITDFSNKNPNQSVLDIKLKYTLDCYAYYKIYNKKLNIKLHHVKTNKDYFTTRGNEDFNKLEITIRNVANSILDNIYYPRESVLCGSCNYINFCKAWRP